MQLSLKDQHMSIVVLSDGSTVPQGQVGRIDELTDPKHVLLDFYDSIPLSALNSNSGSRNRISQLNSHLSWDLRLGIFRVYPGEWFLKCLLWLLGLMRLLLGRLSLRYWSRVCRFWGLVPLSITEAAKQGECHKAHRSTLHHHGFTTTSDLHCSLGAVRKDEMCTDFYNTASMFTSIAFPPLQLAIPYQTWWVNSSQWNYSSCRPKVPGALVWWGQRWVIIIVLI